MGMVTFRPGHPIPYRAALDGACINPGPAASEALLMRLPCDHATRVSQTLRRTLDILELRNKSTMRSGIGAKGPSDNINPGRGLGPPARLSCTGRSVRRATWFQDTFG